MRPGAAHRSPPAPLREQGNVGGCVDPHTAAERAMSHPYETASPEGAPFQLGDQVQLGGSRGQ